MLANARDCSLLKRIAFAAAADQFEAWKGNGVSWSMRWFRKSTTAIAVIGLNIYPFERTGNIRRSLEYTGKLLDRGWSIMLFPEGHLSKSGKIEPFKPGVGLLVSEMHAAVVPAKIKGAYELMDYRYFWPRKRGTITVTFGSPLMFSMDDSYDKITARLEKEVRHL